MPEPESPSVPVTVRVQDGVARISLDRPPLNVLDIDMLRQLNEALRQCDRTSIRVVLLDSAVLQRLDAAIALYRTRVAPSHDAEEGIRDFLDKRTPVWSHH